MRKENRLCLVKPGDGRDPMPAFTVLRKWYRLVFAELFWSFIMNAFEKWVLNFNIKHHIHNNIQRRLAFRQGWAICFVLILIGLCKTAKSPFINSLLQGFLIVRYYPKLCWCPNQLENKRWDVLFCPSSIVS